jgi:hypothetical protein
MRWTWVRQADRNLNRYLHANQLPGTYYCVECILHLTGNDTEERMQKVNWFLPGIALMRRALWIAFTEGEVSNESAFAKRLGEESFIKVSFVGCITDWIVSP